MASTPAGQELTRRLSEDYTNNADVLALVTEAERQAALTDDEAVERVAEVLRVTLRRRPVIGYIPFAEYLVEALRRAVS